jgi:hypothetical protein
MAEHWRKALDVQAVAKAQMQKLLAGQLSGEKSSGLVAVLGDSFIDHGLVVFIVNIHRCLWLIHSRGVTYQLSRDSRMNEFL